MAKEDYIDGQKEAYAKIKKKLLWLNPDKLKKEVKEANALAIEYARQSDMEMSDFWRGAHNAFSSVTSPVGRGRKGLRDVMRQLEDLRKELGIKKDPTILRRPI